MAGELSPITNKRQTNVVKIENVHPLAAKLKGSSSGFRGCIHWLFNQKGPRLGVGILRGAGQSLLWERFQVSSLPFCISSVLYVILVSFFFSFSSFILLFKIIPTRMFSELFKRIDPHILRTIFYETCLWFSFIFKSILVINKGFGCPFLADFWKFQKRPNKYWNKSRSLD